MRLRILMTIPYDKQGGKISQRLFHHTPIPAMTTIPGNRNWLVARTQFNCDRVIVMRRSSRSLGRMEIKSSSEASQLMVFKARSLLPLKLMNPLLSQEELPTTTNRPWEFSLPVLQVPAAAMASGPFLLLGSLTLTAGELKLLVARLVSDESNSFCTVLLSVFLISKERERGKPVAVPLISLTMG